ncbi:hypothetical protein [Humidisolicoccus flavus]|uniref:hypothetical protein n=1 Tax=Humidisolicoccus flavus TaxID=3111414 RepID=UPI0032565252
MLTPVEWIANEPRAPYRPIAIVRVVLLGKEREPYWRAVTYGTSEERQLIGYWGDLQQAQDGVLSWWEHQIPPAWLAHDGKTFRRPRTPPPQKAPPS